MWTPRGTPWARLVGGQAQHLFLCELWVNSGAQPNLGAYSLERDGKDVREGGTPDKPGQYQSNGMNSGVILGPTGSSGE